MKVFKVKGNSLYPDYQNGDFVFSSKIPVLFGMLKTGDRIVFIDKVYGRMIKIISHILETGEYFVEGTHPDSLGSSQLGTIKKDNIIGKVVLLIKNPQKKSTSV